jgi:RNA polymerase sigma-70 factor (ECF subfamily)
MGLTEAVVLDRALEDHRNLDAGFVSFYRETFRRIYALVRVRVPDPDTAQELCSRIYLKAYQFRDRTPGGEQRFFWLLRVANTTVIDYYRTESRRNAVTIHLDEIRDLTDGERNPEERLLARERASVLLRAIGELSPGDREILMVKFVGRQHNQAIGAVLGLSPAAVAMRLMRALRRLRGRLEPLERKR